MTVVPLVGDRDARGDVGTNIERSLELRGVARLAAGQVEIERSAIEVGLEMDFRREAATRTADRLVLLPPLAPAAETWARTTVLSKNCTRCAVRLCSASTWKNASKTPVRLSRQNRFQTLFQLPNSDGRARQVMLCSVKKWMASRNLRSSCPGSPRLDYTASNTASVRSQSASVICVSIAGSQLPVMQ